MTPTWEEIVRVAAEAIAKRMRQRVAEGKPALPRRRDVKGHRPARRRKAA